MKMQGCVYGCEMNICKSIAIKYLRSDVAFQGCVSAAAMKHLAGSCRSLTVDWFTTLRSRSLKLFANIV
jgi:hypothetical protein